MTGTREEIARSAADRLEQADGIPPAVVGFDGFVDSILDAVDSRRDLSPAGYERIRTIGGLSQRIGAAAGKSMNLEIVQREERWGGNGPLLAGVLGQLGAPVTYIGAVGREDDLRVLHPLYEGFARSCERVIPIAAPGRTLALEFDDGKVMLNEPRNVQAVTWKGVEEGVGGADELRKLFGRAALIGVVNWSLLGGVDGIIEGLIGGVLSQLSEGSSPDGRVGRGMFVDLTDPAKRTDGDLRRLLGLLRRLDALAPVMLGLNLAEAERLARVSGAARVQGELAEDLEVAAGALRERLDLACLIIHRRRGAAAARRLGEGRERPEVETASFDGPFVARPRISTGAGDHFNGGFAFAQMVRMPLAESLATGCAVGGFYVREGVAPNRTQLAEFLRELPRPEV